MKHGAKERFCHRLMNNQSLIQMEMILFSATSSSVEKKTKKKRVRFAIIRESL